MSSNKKPDIATQYPSLQVTHAPMCSECNGKLNTKIEEPAKDVIRRLRDSKLQTTLTPSEAGDVARWVLKVCLLGAHPDSNHDSQHSLYDVPNQKFDCVDESWFAWLRNQSDPPQAFSVFISRVDRTPEIETDGRETEVSLPWLNIGEHTIRHFVKSFEIESVRFDAIWHPQWEFKYSLLETRESVQIWPKPRAIDLSTLKSIKGNAVRFIEAGFPCNVDQATFDKLSRTALGGPDSMLDRYISLLQGN
ncbi:hypothetical protein AB0K08_02015 [Citricoccus sp. NPDC055426]|uniref:hypothetical protein n=1 Tax=Citricoccus sp. NPDC055426 TaxID=3155536 RepID=UPI003437E744